MEIEWITKVRVVCAGLSPRPSNNFPVTSFAREANNYSRREWKNPPRVTIFRAGRFSSRHLFKGRDHRRRARPLWCFRGNTLSWKLDERRRVERARKGRVYSFSRTSLTNGRFNYSNNKKLRWSMDVAIKYNVITILLENTLVICENFFK